MGAAGDMLMASLYEICPDKEKFLKMIPETVDIAYRFLYYIDNRYIDNLYNRR